MFFSFLSFFLLFVSYLDCKIPKADMFFWASHPAQNLPEAFFVQSGYSDVYSFRTQF